MHEKKITVGDILDKLQTVPKNATLKVISDNLRSPVNVVDFKVILHAITEDVILKIDREDLNASLVRKSQSSMFGKI